MQHFRGGSEFHKYKSILSPDQSQIIFTLIKATKCVYMPIYVFSTATSFDIQCF